MAKDYKNAPKPKDPTRKKNGGFPGWGWFIVGVTVAVFVVEAAPQVWKKLHHEKGAAVTQHGASAVTNNAAAPAASTADAAPHFDFYKLLPSFQVVIPSQDKETRSGDETGPVNQPGIYILQVGSFQSYEEADKLKANLALLGVESSIQQVKVNNGSTWNRVRIGPIKDLKTLNTLRAKLARNHIEPLVIKTN
ncbi:MAG TPA: SPOR domain-containing protein [Gammaproteobacteria bacterium]|jgi:cell division protein FtsN|nr:SPOR domain-containing protein [Gammaproteobacteria bacterium]